MPKSSKTSGKANAEPKSSQEKLLFDFEVFEEKYHLYEGLRADLLSAWAELQPKAYYDFFLTTLVTFKRSFSVESVSISKRLREPNLFLGNDFNAEAIIKESREYTSKIEARAKNIFKQQVKKDLFEQIKEYTDLFPFEAKYLLTADADDRIKPEFIAYIFFACHRYAAFLSEQVEKHLPSHKEDFLETAQLIIDAKNGYHITKQVLMIVLHETGLLDLLLAEANFGSNKTDILVSEIFGGNPDSIRKIRAGIIDRKQKDCPYKRQHPTKAAEILRSLGYPDKADALITKYRHLIKE